NDGGPTFHKIYNYILHLDLSSNRIARILNCEPEHSFYVYNHPTLYDS
ncbi:DUF1564 family protein, partial [Leptospira gomenensis]